jgi:uncharacterized membrane protein
MPGARAIRILAAPRTLAAVSLCWALALFCVAIALSALGAALGFAPLPEPLTILDARLPGVFRLHMATGGAGLLLLPAVLAARRAPRLHRPLGRAAAGLLLASAATGLPSALMSEAAGGARAGFAAQALLCVLFLARGWRAIRAGDAARHARWMVRAAAVLSGVLWLRPMMAGAAWLWLPFDLAYAGTAWACWALPLAVVLLAQRKQRAAADARHPVDGLVTPRTSQPGAVRQMPSATMTTTRSGWVPAP